ncbi:MAG TPA: SGNH/GDSL hydrolase family protein [Archangium sp.]|nr:SGNH/GDSL hydrolase family protein [Archangium sp.]
MAVMASAAARPHVSRTSQALCLRTRKATARGTTIVNAGVSSQGFYDGLRMLDGEALVLSGITDCIVLLGTNDLSGVPDSKLQANMSELMERLKPFCRTHRQPDIIDFEAVTRAPDNVHHFIDGLDEDGIHPNAAGHRVMADEVVRVLRANGVPPQQAP